MVWRKPRKLALWLGSAFASSATSRSRSSAANCPFAANPEPLHRCPHRLDVDRIRHHRMIDDQRATPGFRHADDHDLVAEQFDSRRTARAPGIERPVVADLGVGDRVGLQLAERDRNAKRTRRARQPHRFQRRSGRDRRAARLCLADPLRRQQRAFDLHEMHVGRIGYPGILHGGAHALCHHRDLAASAEMLPPATPRYARGRSQAQATPRPRLPPARKSSSAAPSRLRCRPTSRSRFSAPPPPA